MHELVSAAVYTVSGGACLGSLDSDPPTTGGVVSAMYRSACIAPVAENEHGVVLQHWGELGATPQCTLEETDMGEYANVSLVANGTNSTVVAGDIGCNATCASESCTGSVDGLLNECIPVDGDSPAHIRFMDVAHLAPCHNAKPRPDPGHNGRSNVPYAAVVVGGTLGGFAVLWLAGMLVFNKMWKKPARGNSVQGDDEDSSRRLVPSRGDRDTAGLSPSGYSSIDG